MTLVFDEYVHLDEIVFDELVSCPCFVSFWAGGCVDNSASSLDPGHPNEAAPTLPTPPPPGPPRPLPSPRDKVWATSQNQICQTNNFGQTNIFRKIDQNQCFHVLGQFSVFDQCGIAGLPSLGQPKISLFLFLPLAKRAHSKAPIIQTPMKFHEKTPREVQKERKWRRERGKNANFGPFRAPIRTAPRTGANPTLKTKRW